MNFTELEIQNIENELEEIINAFQNRGTEQDKEEIRRAFRFAYDAHFPIRRKSGEPYIIHPINVAKICAQELNMDKNALIAALLHDVVEDTDITIDNVRENFGSDVANLVEGLTKISGAMNNMYDSAQIENFRKIFISMAQDYRVILIKLADRLHNIRTLDSLARHKQLKIASETLIIYGPLAERLGLYRIKTELEDNAFRISQPQEYAKIAQKLKDTEQQRILLINKFSLPIAAKLTEQRYDFEIDGRPKSIYSIYKKMVRKKIPFEEIYDIYAIRIIFEPKENEGTEKEQCLKIYSYITDCYKPHPTRFRDWLSNPKENGYEALHSTVMGPTGQWVEVQIRSYRMNSIAENGIASHFLYKGWQSNEVKLEKWLSMIKKVLTSDAQVDVSSTSEYLTSMIKNSEIVVFTPKGEHFYLPDGATVLDFAYALGPQIGEKAALAIVNHEQRPLNFKLRSGDQVKIITATVQKPTHEWVNYATTVNALTQIRRFLHEEAEQLAPKGEAKIKELLEKLQIKFTERIIEKLRQHYQISENDPHIYVLAKVAQDNLDSESFKQILKKYTQERKINFFQFILSREDEKKDKSQRKQYVPAECCIPIPGDDVVGYELVPGVITIHKVGCSVAMDLNAKHGDKIVPVSFLKEEHKAFIAELTFEGIDRVGIVRDLTNVLSTDLNINIREIYFRAYDGIFEGSIKLYTRNVQDLENVISKLKKTKGVNKINRK